MVEIDIDKIEVGLPLFRWLLGRIDDRVFRDNHWDVCSKIIKEGYPTREDYLSYLEKRYEKFINLPILVEKYLDAQKITRYKIRDGHRRLSVVNAKGIKNINCELWQNGWTKIHWEYGRLLDLQFKNGIPNDIIMSNEEIHGKFPFDVYFMRDNEKKYLTSFLIHTGVQVPYILNKSDSHQARGDLWKKTMEPRTYEFIAGIGKHDILAEQLGSHPLNMYLVGHLACGEDIFKDPSYARFGRYFLIQQYFRGGCWGHDVPGYPHNGYPTVKEQIMQNNRAIPLLFKLGIINKETNIYFSDQSADKPCSFDEYFKLFKGENVLEKYYDWLIYYLRTWRSDHFTEPIDKVIECISTQI